MFFFFFQAEDGIRDYKVTGVQTCALPIYTFANTINTAEGGTHEEGFRAALTTVVNKYAREQKLLREGKDDNLAGEDVREGDRKSTRLNSSHLVISYAVFCLKKKKTTE